MSTARLFFVLEINLEFSHFVVRDQQPLLFHAGLRSMFPVLRVEIGRFNRHLEAEIYRLQSFRIGRMWSFESLAGVSTGRPACLRLDWRAR
jgi:hypothetical protein